MPRWQLDRWVAVHDAIEEWYRSDLSDDQAVPDIVNRIMGWMDPVQRFVAERLFATYRQVMPKRTDERVDLDPARSEVLDADTNSLLAAASQIRIETDGEIEHVKLKTGRAAPSDNEKAVLIEGSPDPAIRFVEVALAIGEVNDLELPEAQRTAAIGRLFAIPQKVDTLERKGTRPGLHCFQCPRPARCGQYPYMVEGSGGHSRAVLVSKTWLAKLALCERQVAWARLYSIPQKERDTGDMGPRFSGSAFHEAIASALLSDDPNRVMRAAVHGIEPSEQAELLWLWERHLELVETEPHPLTVRETEYGIGVTMTAPGVHIDSRDREHADQPVAVIFAGLADAVGREAGGTPAVLEHRTGASANSLHLEPELYALGAHLLTGDTPVAVHTHSLRAPGGPSCNRRTFNKTDLVDAANKLQSAAATITNWHPTNSLSPTFRVGDWCTYCPFDSVCPDYRTV